MEKNTLKDVTLQEANGITIADLDNMEDMNLSYSPAVMDAIKQVASYLIL